MTLLTAFSHLSIQSNVSLYDKQSYKTQKRLEDIIDESFDVYSRSYQFIVKRYLRQRKDSLFKLDSLSQFQNKCLQKAVSFINQLGNCKKTISDQEILFCFQQVALILNLYEGKRCGLTFTDYFLKKIVRILQSCSDQTQEMPQFLNQSQIKTKISYQKMIGDSLYIIIIFICKAQKANGQEYQTILKKLLKKETINKILQIPQPQSPKPLKFYTVVLGHIIEKFPNKKYDVQIIKKLVNVFDKVTHPRTVVYMVNILRERFQHVQINLQNGQRLLNRIKLLLKELKGQYQAATVLDLFVNIANRNPNLMKYFYDKQIFEYFSNPENIEKITFPTNCYKSLYYKGIYKTVLNIIRTQEMHKEININQEWFVEKADSFIELIKRDDNHTDQILKIVDVFITQIGLNGWLYLLEKGLYEKLETFSRDQNGKTILGALNILKKMTECLRDAPIQMRVYYGQRVNQMKRQILEQGIHYQVIQKIKSINMESNFCSGQTIMDLQ